MHFDGNLLSTILTLDSLKKDEEISVNFLEQLFKPRLEKKFEKKIKLNFEFICTLIHDQQKLNN